ncbi:MAG: disulfide bond formation protein B, partial [Pseudomonadota bacterium]
SYLLYTCNRSIPANLMRTFLINLAQQRRYWIALIVIGLSLEAAALYYQYVLDEWPCVLCIHIRIWIAAFILVSLIALAGHRFVMLTRLMHLLTAVAMAGFLERSWQVLGVERGWIFGDCDMDLGMPAWFALDKWLPSVFEVQTSCGYTPLLVMNITMAEVLVLISAVLLLLSLVTSVFSWFTKTK